MRKELNLEVHNGYFRYVHKKPSMWVVWLNTDILLLEIAEWDATYYTKIWIR